MYYTHLYGEIRKSIILLYIVFGIITIYGIRRSLIVIGFITEAKQRRARFIIGWVTAWWLPGAVYTRGAQRTT